MRASLAAFALAGILAVYAADPAPPTTGQTADRIAAEVRARYPVDIVVRLATPTGSLVIYSMLADYARLDPSNFAAYEAGVERFTKDGNEATIVLLRRTVEELPAARLVGVFQDSFDVRAWPRDEIESLGEPRSYRDLAAFRLLTDRAFRYDLSTFTLPLNPA